MSGSNTVTVPSAGPAVWDPALAVLDSFDFPYFAVDGAYRYLAFNQAHADSMRRRFGAEVAIGKNLLDFVSVPADRQKARENIDRALLGERVVVKEASGREPNRSFLWISHEPIRGGACGVRGVAVWSHEFQETGAAVQALRGTQDRYLLLFENMDAGFALHRMIYDGDGEPVDYRFLSMNPAFERLSGLSASQAVGRTVRELLPGIEEHWIRTYGQVVLTGESTTLEGYSRDLDRYFEVRAFRPARDQFAVLCTDVTERRRMEEDLRESRTRVKAKLEAVLSPRGEIEALELADVIDVPAVQALMDDFYALTRIGNAILDISGNVLVATGWQDICTLFHRVHPETRRHCLESDTLLTAGVAPGAHKLYRCGNGMWDIVTPILIGGKHLGNLFLGQFLFDDEVLDEEPFRARARAYGFPEEEYIRALRKVPRWSRSTVDTVMRFYGRFAAMLADLSFGNVRLARTLEEQKTLMNSLRESEERFRAIIETSPDSILQMDMKGRLLLANRRFLELNGYESLERMNADGVTAFDLVVPGDRERVAASARRMRQEGSDRNLELMAVDKAGLRYPIELSASLLRDQKGNPSSFVTISRDITERKRAEEKIRRDEERLESLLRIAQRPVSDIADLLDCALEKAIALTGSRIGAIFRYDEDRREFRLDSRPRAATDLGYIADGKRAYRPEEIGIWGEAVRQGRSVIVSDPPEGHAPLSSFMTVPVLRGGSIVAVIGVADKAADYDEDDVRQLELLMDSVWNIVERKLAEETTARLEEQLRQARKMESIGRLAGGVAHDFNNLLTPILGYAELLAEAVPEGRPREELEQIRKAAVLARDLTRQLLAFGRKQVLSMELVDLRRVLSGFQRLLRRTIRENVALRLPPPGPPLAVRADKGQVEQVLMNLAVNAQDAMPDGGTLTMELEPRALDDAYAAVHQGTRPGRYAMLSVSDTGHGMDAETRDRLFEPFFTTKEKGKGTGLGLSTVYGIVKQHGGNIWVYSEPGRGSTFAVYLPLVDGPLEEEDRPRETRVENPRGGETVLVVEDSDVVRALTCRILRSLGYRSLSAADAAAAQEIMAAEGDGIHLLITDMVMPGMDGPQLGKRLVSARPALKVLYMSGYTEDAIAHHGELDKGIHFIQKPFSAEQLAVKVRQALDR